MFGKKKESSVTTASTGSTSTSTQYSSVRSVSGNIIEQRTVSYITTSTSVSSVVTSRKVEETLAGKTTTNGSISKYGPSTTLLSLPLTQVSPIRDRIKSAPAVDAKPYSSIDTKLAKSSSSTNIEYQSPFSRKLSPFASTDARPITRTTELNISSPSNRQTTQPTPFSRNLPSYVSYRSEPRGAANVLSTAASTQSLPSSNELSQHRDPRIPTYDTNGKKRGKVLVINNVKFLEAKEERKGAEVDEKNIRKLFVGLGFEVDVYRDLKQATMLEKVKKFKNDASLKKVDISIVIMMSHGNNVDHTGKVIRGGFTQIYGIDDRGLPIEDVLNQFSGESCPAMAGKPKIFIFQCCRGDQSETLHIDATPIRDVVKRHADMLIAFSTLPGFFSIRDTQQGSWYIECICDVFKKYAKEFDVEQLLKIVDDQLSKKHPKYQQTSTYESRGFKRCYLIPK